MDRRSGEWIVIESYCDFILHNGYLHEVVSPVCNFGKYTIEEHSRRTW